MHYKEIQRLFPELYCMFYNHANKTEKITVKISSQNKILVVQLSYNSKNEFVDSAKEFVSDVEVSTILNITFIYSN